ncbi:type IV toxin-antitoxin system AbiEi family antitoxin domain-containing protein [Rhodococcus sp. G-MC3]|uniref:type IV toxin-antitoxin system AbiEi family antitoxin domain-containing protein n=1 Tax=Rhodococcus sp. G-MC3 TaxID=3046209 RepID=UPI0024BAD036|nr:type IV toxin-antitoxin system AbiEi family antitoxin domain-containing protein [Rhodococcus sp. G-MC3]MDJ0395307.1 type IV toxin-antitoxin system AbiEi family antitoxin domain-containing protein [Rhodococcus sp. G-MC3]
MTQTQEWQSLLDEQHGLVRTAQSRAHGYTPRAIAHRVESGEWLQVLRGVLSVTNGPLTRPMMLSAALLHGGGSSILSHDSAAERWGMMRPSDGPIHITVPYGRSALGQAATFRRESRRPTASAHAPVHPGVAVHRSRAFEHIRLDAEFPMTSSADTAIDLATAASSAREGMIALVQATTNAKVSLPEIRRRIEQREPWRYKNAILDTLGLLTGGVQSALEHRYFLDVEAAHGLPAARRQGPVHVDDRVLFEDVDYTPHGVPLIVRLDGARYHSASSVKFRDRRRDNAAELAGRPRLVYGWEEVTATPCAVFGEVRSVLVREGWRDVSYPCSQCAEVFRMGA